MAHLADRNACPTEIGEKPGKVFLTLFRAEINEACGAVENPPMTCVVCGRGSLSAPVFEPYRNFAGAGKLPLAHMRVFQQPPCPLFPLDDAVFCIDCVAAPCIHPGRARNAAHAACWDRL